MNKASVLIVAGATVVLALGAATSAQAAPAVVTAPSATDLAFMHDNAQTDLAEITVGKIALSRGQSAAAKDLATKTIADHEAALSKLQTIAGSLKVALPTTPNPAQMADAATLKSVAADAFDITYAQKQIAGHELSISGTDTEITAGSDSAVKTYATGYLPVAQMHLVMSEALLKTAGGSAPTAVPAGTGGAGATTSTATRLAQASLGVLGLLLVGFAVTSVQRRRRTS